MLLSSPAATRVIDDRRQELIAAPAQTRFIAAMTPPSPAPRPRTVTRLQGGLRHAVATLAALVAVG